MDQLNENQPLPENNYDKQVFRWVMLVSVIVLMAVIILNRKVLPVPDTIPNFVFSLPLLNACINGTCSIILLASLYFIRRRNIQVHKKLNISAFILSSIFLVSYVLFHYYVKETTYGGTGNLTYIYYFILVTHIILAAGVLPLILLSFYYGLQNNIEKHRKLTRWSYPVWLYVTVTGVVVYLMISPYYKF